MWKALIPVIGFLLQIVLSVISHVFSNQAATTSAKSAALQGMANAAKAGNFDDFLDNLAKFHGA